MTEVVRQTREVLLRIEGGNLAAADNLGTWLTGEVKPTSTSLFKGGDPSAVKPRGATDK